MAQATQQAQPQAAMRPFITGTREIESHLYDQSIAVDANSHVFPTYDFATDGYVAGIYLLLTTSGGANPNSTAIAFSEDGPWDALQTVQFSDVSNRPILGPMSGWELKIAIKYGGYWAGKDPQDSTLYSASAGTTGTGNFGFCLHLPIEFVHRNAMGSLTNLSNAAVFRLDVTLAPSSTIYTTAATGSGAVLPTVRLRYQQHGWMESAGRDPFGNPASPTPPAVDSVQYWERQIYNINAGAQNFRLTPFEGMVRNVIFVLRDSSATPRAGGETNWPDPLRYRYDSVIPVDRIKAVWQRYVEENYNLTAALAANPVNGKENGLYPLAYNRDFGLGPGAEQCFGYQYVSAGTALRWDGTIGSGGTGPYTLSVLFNYVNPAGGNPLALTGGK
jgi:hypothetical protein